MKPLRSSLHALLPLGLWFCMGAGFAQTLPLLTVRSFSWTENQFSTRMPVTISLDAPSSVKVTGRVSAGQSAVSGISPFALATPGPVCGPGVDFVEIVDKLFEIPIGETSYTFEVDICGDDVFEQNEIFAISVPMATLVGARCPNNALSCGSVPTIVNDDTNVRGPVVRIDDVRVQEPLSGTTEAVLTVRLASSRAFGDTTIGYRTQADTAVSNAPNFQFPATSCLGTNKNGDIKLRDFLPVEGTAVIPEGLDRVQIRVPICADGRSVAEPDQRFFVVLTAASSNTGGLADGRGQVTIVANGPPAVGTFQISPDRARVPVGQQQLYQVIWTVPEGKVWRDLNTIALRIRDDERTALWVLWSEIDDSFKLCRQASGSGPHGTHGGDEDDEAALLNGVPLNGCSAGVLAGSPTVLETNSARLHMATTRAVGSGPAGRQVTLSLGISFKPRAIGPQRVELSATDDFGASDPFVWATSVRVLRGQ